MSMRIYAGLSLVVACASTSAASEQSAATRSGDEAVNIAVSDDLLLAAILLVATKEAASDPERAAQALAQGYFESLFPNTLSVGLFPNQFGLLDAHLGARLSYAESFSSGFDFDQTNLQTTTSAGSDARRVYRLRIEALSWAWSPSSATPGSEPDRPASSTSWALRTSLFGRGDFEERRGSSRSGSGVTAVFQQDTDDIYSGGAGISVGSVVRSGPNLIVDVGIDVTPWYLSHQETRRDTSLFPDEALRIAVQNRTLGFAARASMGLNGTRYGDFRLHVQGVGDSGTRTGAARVIVDNLEAVQVSSIRQTDVEALVQVSHGLRYVAPQLGFMPVVALGYSRRMIWGEGVNERFGGVRLGLLMEMVQ